MKYRWPPRMHVEGSDCSGRGGDAACSCTMVVLHDAAGDAVEQQRAAWFQLGTGVPWCPQSEYRWWSWRMSVNSNSRVCLSFSTSPVSGLTGSWGQQGARDSSPSESEIFFSPAETPAGLQPTSAFPARAAQEQMVGPTCVLSPLVPLTKLAAMS